MAAGETTLTAKALTFYSIYIKTSKPNALLLEFLTLTFYSIYIKTHGSNLLPESLETLTFYSIYIKTFTFFI